MQIEQGRSRLRFIFLCVPSTLPPPEQPKTIADSESNEARWIPLEGLDLPPIKDRLRGDEPSAYPSLKDFTASQQRQSSVTAKVTKIHNRFKPNDLLFLMTISWMVQLSYRQTKRISTRCLDRIIGGWEHTHTGSTQNQTKLRPNEIANQNSRKGTGNWLKKPFRQVIWCSSSYSMVIRCWAHPSIRFLVSNWLSNNSTMTVSLPSKAFRTLVWLQHYLRVSYLQRA